MNIRDEIEAILDSDEVDGPEHDDWVWLDEANRKLDEIRAVIEKADREPSDAELDAAYEAFRAHDRGEEFNELGEHVCSECGYAYSWPTGDPVIQVSPLRRRQRHKARAALLAAQEVRRG